MSNEFRFPADAMYRVLPACDDREVDGQMPSNVAPLAAFLLGREAVIYVLRCNALSNALIGNIGYMVWPPNTNKQVVPWDKYVYEETGVARKI